MTEAQFQRQVIELARLMGWRVAHFRSAQRADGSWRTPVEADGAGFPDLVLVRPPELIFAELKTDRGKPTPAQTEWLSALAHSHDDVYIWRPAHWSEIEARLRRGRALASA